MELKGHHGAGMHGKKHGSGPAPATRPGSTASGPWIKDDEIQVLTDSTPWMDIARAELRKNIRELAANDELVKHMRVMLAVQATERSLEESLRRAAERASAPAAPGFGGRPMRLLDRTLDDPTKRVVGRMEAETLRTRNPEIEKYFTGVRSDPIYDRKRRSFPLLPTFDSDGRGRVTAWCAAFVNWCLTRAGVPSLGYGTAKSWLAFGTPLAKPAYGCITIVKPSSATGSTTGHVAFFVEQQGDRVKLLGGNQGDAVTESRFRVATVLGYRWPTSMNHYLLAQDGIQV